MKHAALFAMVLPCLAACGGGDGASNVPVAPPAITPIPSQSFGSHWFVLDSNAQPAHLYVAESGKVQAIFHVAAVTEGPTFGAGTLSRIDNDSFTGVLQARGIQPSGTAPPPVDLSCTVSGDVRERQALTLRVVCSDNAGIVHDSTYAMTPQPGYEAGSSLDDIAGNYTLSFRPATNMLNITADGTLFGLYHNGANCTVNGTVSIIDAKYVFMDAEWTMSNCTDPIGIYEGSLMSGFAMQSPNPNDPPGSYFFLLTGSNINHFFAISVTFEPT